MLVGYGSSSAAGVASAAASKSPCAGRHVARLLLSKTSGPVGVRVRVSVCNCRHPVGQADRLAWQDHYYRIRTIRKERPYDVWRLVPVVRTSRTTARAVFVVRSSDRTGRGILEMWCGGNSNAVAYFTVAR